MNKYIGYFYQQMGVMNDAGMPITRALETAAAGMKGRAKKAVDFVYEEVSAGSMISAAMKKKKIFVPFDVTLIESAEMSGDLSATFKMLADWYEFRGSIFRKLKSSMMMPVFVLHCAFFLGPLPYLFRGFMTGQEYINDVLSKLIFFWGISVTVYLVVKLTPKRGLLRKLFDLILLIIPILGSAVKNFAFGSYCKAFNMLYASGVPITISAELAPDMACNMVIGGLFRRAAESVQSGRLMHEGFSGSIPTEMKHLWIVGEESGQLDVSTAKLADTYLDKAKFGFDQVAFWYPKIFYFGVMIYMIQLVFRNAGTVYG